MFLFISNQIQINEFNTTIIIKLEQRDFIYSEENVPVRSLNGSNRNENLRRI